MLAAAAGALPTLLVLFAGEVLSWAGVPAVGTAALGAAAALAAQGSLHLWAVLVAGVAGAQVGGLIGWGLGRRLTRRPPRRSHEGTIAERGRRALRTGEHLEQRVGGVMVLFVPSWVSGSLGMPMRRFVVWNLLAASLWTATAGLGAYGVGSAFATGSLHDGLVPLIVAALALAGLGYGFLRWRRSRAARRALEEMRRPPLP